MQGIGLVAPVVLPIAAAVISWLSDRLRIHAGRYVCAAGTWLAVAILLASWLPSRATLEAGAGSLGAGIQLGLRLDAVSFAFELFILIPAAVLLTFQARLAPAAALASAAVSASVLAIAAADLLLTVLAWTSAITLLVVLLQDEDERATKGVWLTLAIAGLALLWGAILVRGAGGTTIYSAIPISGLDVQAFVLLALAAVLTAGVVPWRGWVASEGLRRCPRAAGLALATLFPLGFYLLIRVYEVGAGRYPSLYLNLVLAGLGAASALAAAGRAQAASERSAYLAEVIPGLGGFGLMALALGSPLGVTAAVLTAASASLLAAVLPLLSTRRGAPLLFALAVAAGAPPSLVFASRLLDIQAALETGEVPAFLALAAAIAWVWSLAGAARAMRLPAAAGETAAPARAAVALAAFILAAGAGAGVLATTLAIPAAAEVMTFPRSALTGGSAALVTASGAWPAVALAGPLLVAAALALAIVRPVPLTEPAGAAAVPRPYFHVPGAALPRRAWSLLASLRLPPEYRSLVDPVAMEASVRKGEPWFWIAAVGVLALVITR